MGAGGGHGRHARPGGEAGEHRVAFVVVGHALRGQLDDDVVVAVGLDQFSQRLLGGRDAAAVEGASEGTLPASGEDEPVPAAGRGERFAVVAEQTLLPCDHVRLGDGP